MFLFKKSAPLLKDIIPQNYIDIHSHLLPSIDDGSKNIEDTIAMIIELNKLGFAKFVTTPHVMTFVWENSRNTIEQTLNETKKKLLDSNILNPIKSGAEYMMDINFLKLVNSEKLLTLKDDYVLVEMSYLNAPIQLYDIIFDLQLAGYIPVLAHPERYNFYHNNLNEYKKLKNAGCLFQLNLLSTTGYYGPQISKIADYLLQQNMINFVGSDVHHQKHIDFISKKIVLKNHLKLNDIFQNNMIFDF
ncbi:MAG: histidinol phosphatase [Flavobacterium sp.]|nr:histidinol phosphatase [Flavobacterium sp.]